MSRIRGKVRKDPVEGGVYVIDADDGQTYQLAGGDAKLRKEGQRVELDGDVDEGAMGFGMVGPTFQVKTWKPG